MPTRLMTPSVNDVKRLRKQNKAAAHIPASAAGVTVPVESMRSKKGILLVELVGSVSQVCSTAKTMRCAPSGTMAAR
jgi:hypothetical protein